MVRRLLTVLTIIIGWGIVYAQPASAQIEAAYYDNWSDDERAALQYLLIWSGDYTATVDGDFGPLTINAIRSFEARNGFVVDGLLEEAAIEALVDIAVREIERAGFEIYTDDATGAEIGLPAAYIDYWDYTDAGTVFFNEEESFFIWLEAYPRDDFSLAEISAGIQAVHGIEVTYSAIRSDWFVLSGTNNGWPFYVRYHSSPSEIRGFWIEYYADLESQLGRVAVAMSNTFNPFPTIDTALQPEPTPVQKEPPAEEEPALQSGTGFVIAPGVVLTNEHVVAECSVASVAGHQTTRIVRDTQNDMALLFFEPNSSFVPLPVARDPLRLGEPVFAFGYPLAGLLANSLNVTEGIVSSLAGIGGDTRYVQFTAPVQPGNSGGPLVNGSGQVVGIVSLKLNSLAVAAISGDIPEGISFALRQEVVLAFLSANGIAATTAPERDVSLDTPGLVDLIKDSVLPVDCSPAGMVAGRSAPEPIRSAPPPEEETPQQLVGDPASGQILVGTCTGCHSLAEGGAASVGPTLFGLLGRAVGSVPGFEYSSALKVMGNTGAVWSEELLAAFLRNPAETMSGTEMPFFGIASEQYVADIIAYLASLTAD